MSLPISSNFSSEPPFNTLPELLQSKKDELVHIENSFNEQRSIFSELAGLASIVLKICEYITNNKSNIIYIAYLHSQELSSSAEKAMEKLKNNYKIFEYTTLFLLNGSYFFISDHITKKIKNLQESFDLIKSNINTKKEILLDPKKEVKNLYQKTNILEEGAKKETRRAFDKLIIKAAGLFSKTVSLTLPYFTKIRLEQIKNIDKLIFGLFKKALEIFLYFRIDELRIQWSFHLETHIFVYIDPHTPQKDAFPNSSERDAARSALTFDATNYLYYLQNSSSKSDVEKLYQEFDASSIPTLGKFKEYIQASRFRMDLVQHFYYKCKKHIDFSPDIIRLLLKDSRQEKERLISNAQRYFLEQLPQIADFSFSQIKEHFAKEHILLPSFVLDKATNALRPPKTIEEWNLAITNQKFIEQLAENFVEYQLTSSQLVFQAMRQAIFSKIEVERQFFRFHFFEKSISIVLTFVKLFLCVWDNQENKAIKAVVKLFLKDYAELISPFFGVFYLLSPLYPDLKFNTEALLFLLFKQIFAFKYKPLEYGREGYALYIETQLQKALLSITHASFLFKYLHLWISTQFLEAFYTPSADSSLQNSEAFSRLKEEYETSKAIIKQRIKTIESRMYQIRVKDINRTIRNHLKPDSLEKDGDALEVLCQTIESIDLRYMNPFIIYFFEDHLGISLNNNDANNAGLKHQLQKFFIKKEDEFLRTFTENRFRYLRT